MGGNPGKKPIRWVISDTQGRGPVGADLVCLFAPVYSVVIRLACGWSLAPGSQVVGNGKGGGNWKDVGGNPRL